MNTERCAKCGKPIKINQDWRTVKGKLEHYPDCSTPHLRIHEKIECHIEVKDSGK